MFKRCILFIGLLVCAALVFDPAVFAKPGNSNAGGNSSNAGGNPFTEAITGGKGNSGDSSKLDIFNVKGVKNGLIKVDKNIFYPTDTLDISIVFPKSLKAVWNGDADTYLVIRMTDGTMLTPFQVSASTQTADSPKSWVTLDLTEAPLPEGDYQLALIMVVPGGDALSLSDWYGGFSGLISATTFEVATQCDPADGDCDGIVEASGLIVTPANVSLESGGAADLTVANGEPPYAIESADTSVATVSPDTLSADGTFTVTAAGPVGAATAITVTDNMGDVFLVNVAVSSVLADPASVSLILGDLPAEVTVTGGTAPYTVASSDETIATAALGASGDTVEISAVGTGPACVSIMDDNGEIAYVQVSVADAPATTPDPVQTSGLTADPASAVLTVGGTPVTVTITGGSGTYTVGTSDDTVATATTDADTVEITAVGGGTAAITVTDSSDDTLTLTIDVTVTDNTSD